VALHQAIDKLLKGGTLKQNPLVDQVAAISCGIYQGHPVLDLDYDEDSQAEADANFVLTGKGQIIEVQATAEKTPFDQHDFEALMELARSGVDKLVVLQRKALGLI